jgi:hypothetical protein
MDEDLSMLRATALGVGKEAIGNLIRGSMSVSSESDLGFWERVESARRFLTRPGGKPPEDKEVAKYLGLSLDELNRKKFEHRIQQETSYERLTGMGVEPRRLGVRDAFEEMVSPKTGAGMSEAMAEFEAADAENEGEPGEQAVELIQETFQSPEVQAYLNQIGAPPGFEDALAYETMKYVMDNMSRDDMILLETYAAGGRTAGMTERKFQLKIFGGYDPGKRQQVPGLVDRVRNQLMLTASAVSGLSNEAKADVATGEKTVGQAIAASPAASALLSGAVQTGRPISRRRLPAILG